MKKMYLMPVLVLAAGLAASFSSESADAGGQGSSASNPGSTSQLNAPSGFLGTAPRRRGDSGRETPGPERKEEGVGGESDVRRRQEQFGVSPELEEPPGPLENQQDFSESEGRPKQEQFEAGPGDRPETEQFGVVPEAGEEPPAQSGAERQERSGTEPEEEAAQEAFGRVPQVEEEPPEENQERSGRVPGQRDQEQFGVSPRFERDAREGQGWVSPATENESGSGWRRKSVPQK